MDGGEERVQLRLSKPRRAFCCVPHLFASHPTTRWPSLSICADTVPAVSYSDYHTLQVRYLHTIISLSRITCGTSTVLPQLAREPLLGPSSIYPSAPPPPPPLLLLVPSSPPSSWNLRQKRKKGKKQKTDSPPFTSIIATNVSCSTCSFSTVNPHSSPL